MHRIIKSNGKFALIDHRTGRTINLPDNLRSREEMEYFIRLHEMREFEYYKRKKEVIKPDVPLTRKERIANLNLD